MPDFKLLMDKMEVPRVDVLFGRGIPGLRMLIQMCDDFGHGP